MAVFSIFFIFFSRGYLEMMCLFLVFFVIICIFRVILNVELEIGREDLVCGV